MAESNHLVDILNQTDLVEDPDGEDKLGQPLASVALVREWGTLEFHVLPGFRERTFPGQSGRLRTLPRVDTSSAHYESAAGRGHVDFAVRYAGVAGPLDFGLYHFHGTAREPELKPQRQPGGGPWVLAPWYAIIDQTGLDALYTWGNLALKLEALHRRGQSSAFSAAVGGFEYTWTGPLAKVWALPWDLGLLAEYHHDGRPETLPTVFDHDLFVGFRVSANDFSDTRLLLGAVQDLAGEGTFYNLEASRRLSEHWSLEAELRVFASASGDIPLRFVEHDDYLQITLSRYF